MHKQNNAIGEEDGKMEGGKGGETGTRKARDHTGLGSRMTVGNTGGTSNNRCRWCKKKKYLLPWNISRKWEQATHGHHYHKCIPCTAIAAATAWPLERYPALNTYSKDHMVHILHSRTRRW